jgi:hypothetical protein
VKVFIFVLMKRSFADILQGLDSDRAAKMARKLPEWATVGAEIPTALALEQCSSSATASYKATVAGQAAVAAFGGQITANEAGQAATAIFASRSGELPPETSGCAGPLPPPSAAGPSLLRSRGWLRFPGAAAADVPLGTVLDLTGGLGVDSWAFAQVAERVVYFERDSELAAAAKRNFARLGVANIEVRSETVTPESELPEADLIYADPARRNAAGRKVFLLEDCTPDILTLLPMLLRKAPAVLLKLSPMADLAMLTGRLGSALREIHVVEFDGEVKELLCLLVRDAAPAEPDIILARLSGQAACLRFRISEERGAEVRYAAEVRPGDVLLEPCPALLKAGAFRLPCARWGLQKLAVSTHLYLLPAAPRAETPHFAPGEQKKGIPGAEMAFSAPGILFFKAWRVRDTLPFGTAAFRELRKRYPRADVTSRNMPLGSAELQKKIGIAPGSDVHIFACRLADGATALIVTTAE